MTITDLIPALKGTGRRRAADDAFMLLHQELADARGKQAEAEEIVVSQQADIDDLTAERDMWRDDALALRARFSAQLAAEANANRIDVPPMVRDTSAIEDQATGPIDVSPLWAARDAGLLGPVTDPGRIGPDDDTQPIEAI